MLFSLAICCNNRVTGLVLWFVFCVAGYKIADCNAAAVNLIVNLGIGYGAKVRLKLRKKK